MSYFLYVLIYDMLKKTIFMSITTEILDKNDWYTGLTVAGTGDKILMSRDCTIAQFFYTQSNTCSIVSTRDLNHFYVKGEGQTHEWIWHNEKKLQARVINFN